VQSGIKLGENINQPIGRLMVNSLAKENFHDRIHRPDRAV
jgi:hypothetical protein